MPGTTFVVGTAGHVDHGKSTLVERLTGIDPDRLQEEKDREMTIDLGFAWLDLPSGGQISIVDVPGHERFIKNMLAGVGGIDAAVLVIAADEGPMPQTAEHLAIIDLLDIHSGVVALTKSDLVDHEWLELVTEEVRETIDGTSLEGAAILPVSSMTGAGVDELIAVLDQLQQSMPPRQPTGRPRLSVDRVFSVAGFGTVVTGTLLGDKLETRMELELLPAGRTTRIRGLQVHGDQVTVAGPGSRTAVNISGIDRHDVKRGDLLTVPGWLQPTAMIDVQLRLIPSVPRPLEQNQPVDFFSGAAEVAGHMTLLNAEQLLPGETGWVQIRLAAPVAVVDGDLFVVRQPSPGLTIGGGTVVNSHPYRHRRYRDHVIDELETRLSGTPIDRVAQLLTAGPITLIEVERAMDLSRAEVIDVVSDGVSSGRIVVTGESDGSSHSPGALVWSRELFERTSARVVDVVTAFHLEHPLRMGMPKQELRSRLRLASRAFDSILDHLEQTQQFVDSGNIVQLTDFSIKLTEEQRHKAGMFIAALDETPDSPPAPGEFGIDSELLTALHGTGQVVRISDTVVFSPARLAAVRDETLRIIDQEGDITLAAFRDHFGSSRKYAQAVLEYFDQHRVTRRVGDVRVRGSG